MFDAINKFQFQLTAPSDVCSHFFTTVTFSPDASQLYAHFQTGRWSSCWSWSCSTARVGSHSTFAVVLV